VNQQLRAVFALIVWMAVAQLSISHTTLAAASPESLRSGAPDRTELQDELTRSMTELQAWSDKDLRAYVDRLAQLQSSLEWESDLLPQERRDLNERLLARAAQVGLLLRERAGAAVVAGSSRRVAAAEPGAAWLAGLVGTALGDSGILVGLLGGLAIAFALGNLMGYRRGARQASYYGEGDPRLRFLTRPPAQPPRQGVPGRISLQLIREALSDGRTVLLQLGYDIAPSRRPRYLELLREMQEALEGSEGLTHTAWEDPRHPHRFYELLVCQRPAALDALTTTDGLLARLGEDIEACRHPSGLVLRRVWWSISAGSKSARSLLPFPDAASIRGGVS
jgi:hypothetical protein